MNTIKELNSKNADISSEIKKICSIQNRFKRNSMTDFMDKKLFELHCQKLNNLKIIKKIQILKGIYNG